MSLTGLATRPEISAHSAIVVGVPSIEVRLQRQTLIAIFHCAFLSTWLVAQAAPERKVEGSLIISKRDPAVEIQLPKSANYIGADRWVLYDIADCELHAFVEADAQHNVQRLYWVQFEGYVPTQPELKHTYNSPQHTQIGGLDFYVDTWVRAGKEETTPGSDREHIEALIRAHGDKMPAGMMYVRLVHLLDDAKRKELMIIYGEYLAPTGFSVVDLNQGGRSQDRWPQIAKSLVERAQQKVVIRETRSSNEISK
jgi:hypothetical protein